MIDLQHVKTFLTVATTKNFSQAAVLLGYSQSSVTHHIKMLERELGTSLFDRFRFARTVALTDAGRVLFGYAQRLLALADGERRMSNYLQLGEVLQEASACALAAHLACWRN